LPLAAIFDNFLNDGIRLDFFSYLKIGKKDMHSIKPKDIAEIEILFFHLIFNGRYELLNVVVNPLPFLYVPEE